MKEVTKFFLKSLGVWHFATFLRSLPEIKKYKKEGFSGPAPYPVKMRIVRNYVTKYNLKLFVETGTYLGKTLRFIADLGIRCISIELSEKLYEMAQDQFKPYKTAISSVSAGGLKLKKY